MSIFRYFSLFIFVLGAYFLVIEFADLESQIFGITFQNGADFTLTISDTLVIFGVISLFIETVKSARYSSGAIAESSMSIFLSILFLILFLLYSDATTSTFLILMLLSFTESITGFIIAVSTARRDFAINGE